MDFGLRVGFRGGFDQSVQSSSGMQKVDMLGDDISYYTS